MKKTDVYKQADQCMLEDMDGELLIYNPDNATTLHLNGPSAIVWQLCNGEHSVQEIIEALTEAYPEQAEQIDGDVTTVIADLLKQETLKRVSA